MTTQGRDMVVYVDLAAKSRRDDYRAEGAQDREPRRAPALGNGHPADVRAEHGAGLLPLPECQRRDVGGLHQHAVDRSVSRRRAAPSRSSASSAASTSWRASWAWTRSSCGARTSSSPTNSRTQRRPGAEYDSGDYERALDKALELARLPRELSAGARRGPGARRADGHRHFDLRRAERQRRRRDRAGPRRAATGSVTLVTGSHSHGQGHETSFAQIVADQHARRIRPGPRRPRRHGGDRRGIGHLRQPQHDARGRRGA